MHKFSRAFNKMLFSLLPDNNPRLYRVCKRYVDRYLGQNNHHFATNGELRLLGQVLPNSVVVFDVGANTGQWTKMALEINPGLKIHCFEPSHYTFSQLAKVEFPDHVKLNFFGLSNKNESAELFIFEDGAGINSLYPREGLQGHAIPATYKKETVELHTLNAYCHEKNVEQIDFLKLDVEGHELRVIEGADQMIKNLAIQLIQFEYGGCNIDSGILLKDIFKFFRDLPYKFYKVFPNRLEYIPAYNQRYENFQYQNWLIARQDRIIEI
jgi:FkbM family methyltransferase